MEDLDESVEDESKISGKFLSGILYFMQETDYLSGEKFHYYKIGIVKGERDVVDREKDHKTGNPRCITSVKDIPSPAVQILETYLHNTLAKHRVSSGEWFFLPGDLLQKAISSAEDVREKLKSSVEGLILETSKNKSSHAGAVIRASEELKRLVEATLQAQELANHAADRRKRLGDFLKSLAGEEEHFAYLFKTSSIGEKKSFDTAAFSKANKEIYEKYKNKQSSSWSMKFLVKFDSGLVADELELEACSPLQLHQLYLEAWSEQEKRALEHTLLEAQLVLAVGESAAVDGLVEWRESRRVAFDVARFKAENPELAAQFVKVTPEKLNKSVAEWASYRN